MSIGLPLAETLERIRSAFSPLNCAATAWDHYTRIKVTVFDFSGEPPTLRGSIGRCARSLRE